MHKKKILLGTSNQGKVTEFLFYLEFFKIFQDFEIITLNSYPNMGEPEENETTFDGNASSKSSFFYNGSNLTCLSDDSGFIINGSDNFPGVKTARLAKEKGGISGAIKNIFYDFTYQTEKIMEKCGLKPFDKVVLSQKKISPIKIQMPQAKRLGYTVKVHQYLLVYKKE